MRSNAARVDRFKSFPKFEENWQTFTLEFAKESIQFVNVVLEGYDNISLVRTPVAGEGRVHVYVSERNAPILRQALIDINRRVPLKIASVADGMAYLEDLWEEPES